MSPIDRRRRRRRISRLGAWAVVGVVVALLVATLAGGLLRARSQSVGYERAVDRSYAVQARPVVEASNRLDGVLRSLLAAMPGDDRTTLELALDTLVRSTRTLAGEAATAASPAPSGGAGTRVAVAMADRASAMRTFRTTVDRLLGMAPPPVVGSPDPARPTAAVRPLSVAGAAAALSRVGVLLAEGDRSYALGRRVLRRAPGHADLPSSVWHGGAAAWGPASALATADALSRSPTLAAVRRVELVTHALVLTPAPVPSPSAGTGSPEGGVSVIPPTGRVRIAVVVANDGDVAERGIVVWATVAATGGVTRRGKLRHLSLAAHSSRSVTLPAIGVVPDHGYTFVVTVDPPLPNVPGTTTTATVSVRVAPPSPPTVDQLVPAEGPDAGGTDVTVLGSGFTWVSGVRFGTVSARFEVVSSTQITAVAPPGTGTVDVRVTNSGGASGTSAADRYRYRRA